MIDALVRAAAILLGYVAWLAWLVLCGLGLLVAGLAAGALP